jgi:hypothetical protein
MSFLDWPLLVSGFSARSSAATAAYEEFGGEWPADTGGPPSGVPLGGFYRTNVRAASALVAKTGLPDSFAELDLHWEAYFVQYYRELLAIEGRGRDVGKHVREYWKAVSSLPPGLRWSVRWKLAEERLRAPARLLVRSFKPLDTWRRRRLLGPEETIYSGDEVGFDNIAECGEYVRVRWGRLRPVWPPATSRPLA